jgi:pilus assembly protein CpaB
MILASLVLAVCAAALARNWLHARLDASNAPNTTQFVVVAALEIPFATKVEARHLRTITLPRDASVGNHYDKPEDVIGLIALQKAIPGEILLRERFADRNGGTLAAIVKTDMRAVTVRVDDVIGVAGFLMPGNHVDVVASRMLQQQQRAETRTVLRDVNVLAVDQSANQDKDQPVIVRAVTLEVTPMQAEALVQARDEGRIQLTLRNPQDKSDDAGLVAGSPAPPPAPARKVRVRATQAPAPAPATNGVTIIRGTNVKNSESAG